MILLDVEELSCNGIAEKVTTLCVARIQLLFPGKPDEQTRRTLKSHGFRWSPSQGELPSPRAPLPPDMLTRQRGEVQARGELRNVLEIKFSSRAVRVLLVAIR